MRAYGLAFFLLAGSTMAQIKGNGTIDPSSIYGVPSSAVVSTAELEVPERARKELRHANELLVKQDYLHALKRLNQAITIYPAYPDAYNNLAVVYAQLGDLVQEREALEQAIRLNDHFALAHLNLGRMHIASADFVGAEAELEKAASLNPPEPVTLILLAYTELMEGHLDDVVFTTRKAHALRAPHAFAHRLAARALERRNQLDRAIAELQLSLSEESAGPRAEAARNELKILNGLTH